MIARIERRTFALVLAALLAAPPAHALGTPERCIAAADAGQKQRDSGRLVSARAKFTECSAAACPALVRADCATWLSEVERALPSVVFIVRTESGEDARDVRVSMDGALIADRLDGTALAVDPGEHRFSFDVAGKVIEQVVLVHAGERNRPIHVRVPGTAGPTPVSPPTPFSESPPVGRELGAGRTVPLAPPLIGAGGVLVLGAGIVFGAIAKSDLDQLKNDPCAATRQCRQSDVDSIASRYIVADVLMGAGVVALGIATILWLTQTPSEPARR